MELKPGYKLTEVGVIPEEWEVRPLSSCISYGPRNGYSGKSGKDARGTPTLSLTATTSGRMVLDEESVKHLEETLEGTSDILLKKGDVLVQRSNTLEFVGTTAIFDGPCGVYAYPDLMMRMRFKMCETSHWFWRYANSSAGRRYFVSVAAGSTGTMPKLSGDKLRKMPLPFPPPLEQRAIASALCDVDELLGGLDRLIAKKRDLKQAAMQQLLTGQIRLPGFSGEWEVRCLKTIVEKPVTDGPHLTPRFIEDGIPFLSVNNLVGNKIDLGDIRFISRQDHEVFSRKCKPQKGDILLGKAASVGKVAIVELTSEFNIWSPIALIRVLGSCSTRFVYYQLQSVDLICQITLLTNSSSQGNIGMGDIEKLTLRLPARPEQVAIAEVLTVMDAELAALEQRRNKTRDLKQAMMQELLTGRTQLV